MASQYCRCFTGHVRIEFTTSATPAQVRSALTDFTDRRPDIWRRTLNPKTYELRGSGETWAEAKESTSGSPFWVVARYDWSDPDVVRWTVTESSYGGSGRGVVRAAPIASGGSRVVAEWDYTDARRLQRPLLLLIEHGPLRHLIARLWTSSLDRFAREDAD